MTNDTDRLIANLAADLDAAIADAEAADLGEEEFAYRAFGPREANGTMAGVHGRIVQHADARPDGRHLVVFTLRQTRQLRERLDRLAEQQAEVDPVADRPITVSGDEAIAKMAERHRRQRGG